jgi:hypothetical protein
MILDSENITCLDSYISIKDIKDEKKRLAVSNEICCNLKKIKFNVMKKNYRKNSIKERRADSIFNFLSDINSNLLRKHKEQLIIIMNLLND